MSDQPNFSDNQEPVEPTLPDKPLGLPAQISHWFIVVLAIMAVLSFFITSYFYNLWPFNDFMPQLAPLSPLKTLEPPLPKVIDPNDIPPASQPEEDVSAPTI